MSFIKKYFLFFFLFFVTKQSLFSQVTNPNGYNTFYYDNGAKSSEGTMRDGKADGYWKNYYKNGKVKIGDMNVSKVLKNNLCLTQTGTPYYASP